MRKKEIILSRNNMKSCEKIWKKIINNSFKYFPVYIFLLFLSFIYKGVLILRNSLYDNKIGIKKSELFIISVGNLTVGGTGKTLFVLYLLDLLNKNNISSSVLTRGYKRKNKKENLITSDGNGKIVDIDFSGDEAFMIAESCEFAPILVGKNRFQIAQLAKEKFNVKTGILDDGFQHRKLYRDIDILLIDASNPFGNNNLFPAGILREPIKNMKRADIIVLTKSKSNSQDKIINLIKKYNNSALIFESGIKQICFIDDCKNNLELDCVCDKKILLLSSIGNPNYFYSQVMELNPLEIIRWDFSDHYEYNSCDIGEIEKECKKNNIDYVVTTHKDMVKLKKFKFEKNIIYLKIEILLSNKDEEQLMDLMKTKLGLQN